MSGRTPPLLLASGAAPRNKTIISTQITIVTLFLTKKIIATVNHGKMLIFWQKHRKKDEGF